MSTRTQLLGKREKGPINWVVKTTLCIVLGFSKGEWRGEGHKREREKEKEKQKEKWGKKKKKKREEYSILRSKIDFLCFVMTWDEYWILTESNCLFG